MGKVLPWKTINPCQVDVDPSTGERAKNLMRPARPGSFGFDVFGERDVHYDGTYCTAQFKTFAVKGASIEVAGDQIVDAIDLAFRQALDYAAKSTNSELVSPEPVFNQADADRMYQQLVDNKRSPDRWLIHKKMINKMEPGALKHLEVTVHDIDSKWDENTIYLLSNTDLLGAMLVWEDLSCGQAVPYGDCIVWTRRASAIFDNCGVVSMRMEGVH